MEQIRIFPICLGVNSSELEATQKERYGQKLDERPTGSSEKDSAGISSDCHRRIKNEINRRHPQKIQLQIEGAGLNTVSLFEKAKALVAISPNVYKHVWIVYDTDDFPANTSMKCRTS